MIKKIAIAIGALIFLISVSFGGLLLWVGSGAIEAPDVRADDPTDSQVYDQSFLPVIEVAQERIANFRRETSAPSVSIAVALDGEILWAEVQGFADLERRTPASLDSRYTIGSVSKSVTATLAMQLVEQGVLDLDADIHTYIPDYPALPFTLTTRQLLSHQGGIRHYRFAPNPPVFSEMALNQEFETTADALSLFSDDPLLFEPDTDFSYTTYGYTLAGAAIEGATGEDLFTLLSENLFVPLGMSHSAADTTTPRVPNRVSGYLSLPYFDGLLPSPEVNLSNKWAGGGIASTPTDLVRFGNAVLAGEIVSPDLRDEMWTPRSTSDGELNPQHYGLGWRNGGLYYPSDSENIITLINHGGTAIDGLTALLIFPESGLVVAMTANVMSPDGSGPLRSEAAAIARRFLDHIEYVPEGYVPE